MQKEMSAGDALLAGDVKLFEPVHPGEENTFFAYPSRRVPRFIAQSDDDAALKFFATLVSADRGVLGALLRFLVRMYFVPRLLARIFAERFVPLASHGGPSFTERVRQFVYDNRSALPRAAGELRVAKFCQRIAGPDTKILFLVTDEHGALCIVKTMRSSAHDEKLRREASAQRELAGAGIDSVPSVYFDGMIEGRYIYVEEAIDGMPVSRHTARAKEKEIVALVSRFPVHGSMSSPDIAAILAGYAPEQDAHFAAALERLRSRNVTLKTGLTHSDLGRVNILHGEKGLRIIDWGRANERPFYLIDAVYLLTRIRDIKNADDWQKRGAPALVVYTGIAQEAAEALYDILVATEILYKKYPQSYASVIRQFYKPT